ncbi:hypothetical protein CR513_42133, partial [Mucuna pruriens]
MVDLALAIKILHSLRPDGDLTWTLYVDGSSNSKRSGAGILLGSDTEMIIEQLLTFIFLTSNN